MKQRGRRSVASLAVVTPLPQDRRPAPPSELTAEQAAVWRDTVNAMPSDWFGRESFAVLGRLLPSRRASAAARSLRLRNRRRAALIRH